MTKYNKVPQAGAADVQHDSELQSHFPRSSRDTNSLPNDDDEFSDNTITRKKDDGLTCSKGDHNSTEKKTTDLQDDGIREERVNNISFLANPYPYAWSIAERVLMTNLVDDKRLLHMYRRLCHAEDDAGIDDGGLAAVKLIKLWTLSIIGIIIVHLLAGWMEWEIDEDFDLHDFVQYDFATVLLDLLFFFVVGRLYRDSCNGIDTLSWGMFITMGSIYPSIANDFDFLRHSISMYDMMCGWPIMLFVYASGLCIMAAVFTVALVRSHHRRNVIRSRAVEFLILACLFILPYAQNDSFHLHHWFGMWWLGMQSNAPEIWARSFQAFCLGSYLNGIAVYGRDPILGCNYAFYRSTNLECEFMECYKGGNETEMEYDDFVAPDWRTCNAASLKNATWNDGSYSG